MKKIQPISGNVLLQEVKKETNAGGIIIPDTVGEKKNEGKVVAIAPDATDTVSVGDIVIYRPMSGDEISADGETYLIVPDSDIIAKYVEAEEI